MTLNGEDESVIAELLASIANLNISVLKKMKQIITDLLSGILSELSTMKLKMVWIFLLKSMPYYNN